MRSLLLFICISFSSFNFLKAENTGNQLLENLTSVNKEWSKQPECKSMVESVTISDAKTYVDWIAIHLRLVEETLRARSTNHLSSSQVKNRTRLLNELNGYWKARSFPVNDYLTYKNPIFIDRTGTHCAVGYLMQQSGAEELAQKINSEQKFAYVHEIKVNGVKEWANKNGFTIDELAWIQPAYQVQIDAEDMKDGLNGTVNTIAVDPNSQTVYVGGSFNASISGTSCQNIGAWISGFAGWDWISVGSGVNRTVHSLLLHNNKLYVGGEFTMANGVAANHIAVYDISLGQWQTMGSLDSTVRTLAVYDNEVYAGGDFTGYVSKWSGTQWQDVTQGFIYGGGARTLEVWNSMLVIGGDFELATGALRKHVTTYNGSQMGTLGFGTLTPVNDFTEHEGKLFAACDVINGTDTCALASYDTTGQWNVELKPFGGISDAFEGTSIRSLYSYDNKLLAAGDFLSSSGMIYGNNLMAISKVTYDTTTYTYYEPMLVTDQAVHQIAITNNTLYFGGSFVTNGFTDTLNRIGYLELTPTGIGNGSANLISSKVFPNPANSFARIQAVDGEKLERIEMYDVSARKIMDESVNASSKDISLQHLNAGIYTVRAFTKNGWGNMRLVKK